MNRRFTHARLYVPTLLAADGTRHIIPARDGAPLCGAPLVGTQHEPSNWLRGALCQRCVQKHMRDVLNIRLEDFGL